MLGWSALVSATFALRTDLYPGTAVQGEQAAFLIGGLVGLLIAGSAVALLVAIPRGGAPGGTPTPLWRFPAVGAVTGAVLLAVVLGWWTGRAPETRTFVIGSPADGCRSFTALLLGAVKDHESDAAMRADVTALRDAAQIHDPDLATDLEPLLADLSDPALAGAVQADSQTAAKNIYGRCLKEGWMTPQEVTAVGDQLNSLLGR
ncbi:MAG: hypothetical protein GC157_02260 [Frankiales bacterium]|nr:hypothetical protein [Frankiales bacterium]